MLAITFCACANMRCIIKLSNQNNVRCENRARDNQRVCEEHYNELNDCSICCEKLDYKSEQCSLLPCKHAYHMNCIYKYYVYIKKKNSILACPNCKSSVDDNIVEHIYKSGVPTVFID